jgi:DNA-binding MarR family transcriptional regulator
MSPEQLHAWELFHEVNDALRREVGRELWNDAQLSDAEFTVLAHLHASGGHGIRPVECANAIGWDSSRLAHQVRRLQKRGFVETGRAEGPDARATAIRLTDAGSQAYRKAIGPHLRSAHRWFAEALEERDVADLTRVLERLYDHTRRLAADAAGNAAENDRNGDAR